MVDYLLNPGHPDGEGTARFFLAAGFQRHAPDDLGRSLLEVARTGEMVATPHAYGTKFECDSILRAPNGEVHVRRVWPLGRGRPPRCVTAHPLRRRG